MAKGSLAVILLVFVTAILLNVILLTEGFSNSNSSGKDGTCYRRLADQCELKTVNGSVGCYDKSNIKCDADCCDTKAEVVTEPASKPTSTTSSESLDKYFKSVTGIYKPSSTDSSSSEPAPVTAQTTTSSELDSAYNQLSDEAKVSTMDKIRALLRSDVQKAVKDELLASRSTNPTPPVTAQTNSPALQQGSCFRGASVDPSSPQASPPYATGQQSCDSDSVKPTESVDMSQYIRKDSIPCYGCTLPQ